MGGEGMSMLKRSAVGLVLLACGGTMLPAFTGSAHAANLAVPIRSAASGKCLDADANFLRFNGDRVQLWDCNGGDNQQWRPLPNRDNQGTIRLENAADGKVLDADANGIWNNGDKVQLWDWTGAGEQRWFMEYNPSTNAYRFRNLVDNKYLDADANQVWNNGGRVQVWDGWGGANQIWY